MAKINSSVNVTPGNGQAKIATYRISEDDVNKELHRFVFSNSLGQEMIIPALNSQNSLYSNIYGDFIATPTVDTDEIVISGIESTDLSEILDVSNFMFGAVKVITAAGIVTDIPLNQITWTENINGGTLAIEGVEFETGDKVAVIINGPLKAYDVGQNTIKTPYKDFETDTISVVRKIDYFLNGLQKIAPVPVIVNVTDTANIVDGITGTKLRVAQFILATSADVGIKFQSRTGSTDTDRSGVFKLKAGETLPIPINEFGYAETPAGHTLRLHLSTPATVTGFLMYLPL